MRTAHYIRGNAKSETPSEAIWFDTETTQERVDTDTVRHRLWFGWAAYRRRRSVGKWTEPEWQRFTDATGFWNFVTDCARPKTKLYIFCHNTNFDLPVVDVFGILFDLGWKLTSAVIDAPPTMLRFRRGNTTLLILDTLNLFRMPLAALGKMIGVPKLDMPDPSALSETWNTYARQDVTVIMEACLRWWSFLVDKEQGGFAPTLAGQAFRTYRHRYMPTKILVDDNPLALSLARSSYVGGRCECFRIGKIAERIHVLDINSMYPAVMAEGLYPARLLDATDRYGQRALDRYLDSHCVVADVTLDTDQPVYPKVHDEKLCFPIGRFSTVLTGPELRMAVLRGDVRVVRAVAVYHPEPLFKEFVNDMYQRRQQEQRDGNDAASWLYKILMNSLYGKFGQRGLIWEETAWVDNKEAKVWSEINVDTGIYTRFRQLGGLVQRQSREAEGRDSCPAIAAYVTSYARCKLWSLIEEAGRANVYYVDTDSLVVNDTGLRRLRRRLNPTDLGALKKEGTYPGGEIWGPKDYRFGDKERHKGVRVKAVWLSANTIEQDKWSSLRGSVRNGTTDRATTATIRKTLRRVYNKGLVGPLGVVSPLVLDGE